MFKLLVVCSNNLFRNCIGQIGSMVTSVLMKWYLYVSISLSLSLSLLGHPNNNSWGGVVQYQCWCCWCIVPLLCYIHCSSRLLLVCSYVCPDVWWLFECPHHWFSLVLVLIGMARIALISCTYATKISFMLLYNRTGSVPIWSVYILPVFKLTKMA